jgi:outer membrane protein assembly factor BamB/tRNA A-37 threonylcarbamoyl transferase component Bud32
MPDTTQLSVPNGELQNDNTLKANVVLYNRYKITGVLGGGGMGTVYQARDLNFTDVKKLVAVKEMQTLQTDANMRASMLKTFRREANILATLNHPAIPKIFDFFDMNDRAYLVMEYINGSDLELLMSKTKELPLDKIIEWAIDLCDVLDYLHGQKPDPIVFRDMKPSNVMIDNLGKVRLIDFGIAKSFVVGANVKHTMIGTEGYSAAEQYRGEVIPQSDIYGLGATLHHLLTRQDPRLQPPFSFNERPIQNYNPKVPQGLVDIIEKALQINAVDRYRSCLEMRDALDALRHPAIALSTPATHAAAAATPQAAAPIMTGAFTPEEIDQFQMDQAGTIQAKWIFKAEDEIRSAPTVVRGTVIVGAYDNNTWGLKLENGELLWKFPTRGGIASAPSTDEASRLAVFGSEDYTLYAIDFTRGRVSWTYSTKDRIRSGPRIAHEHVFVGSDDGKLYALGLSSGRFLWHFDYGSPVRTRPFVTNDLVIAGCETGEIIAVTLSGQRKWSYRTRKSVISSPYVDLDEGICFVGSTDGYLYALDANSGYSSWRFRTTGPIYASPVQERGLVYFGSADGHVYAVSAQNAREKWKFNTEKPVIGSPVVSRGAVYIGSTDGTLFCLDAENGKERWRYKTGGPITAAPAITDSLVLVASMDHRLYALPLV